MKDFKVRGLIINEMAIGESDKRIVIYSKEKGKIQVFAKGARKTKSELLAGTQLFSYCDFVLVKTRNSITISQISIIESFYNIRQDIYKLSYAMYAMEVLEYVGLENESNYELLKLTLKTLLAISNNVINIKLIIGIYEIKIMSLCGYKPQLYKCVICDEEENNFSNFSSKYGGVLCSKCKNKYYDTSIISTSTLYSMRFIIESDLMDLFSFNVSDEILEEIVYLSNDFIRIHLDKIFKTKEYIKSL